MQEGIVEVGIKFFQFLLHLLGRFQVFVEFLHLARGGQLAQMAAM